jgi:hypothetical protein
MMNLFDILYHEAGHAVAAVTEGVVLQGKAKAGLSVGHVPFDEESRTQRLTADVQTWGPKYIKVWLAGRAAQEQYAAVTGNVLFESDEGWSDDYRKATITATEGIGLKKEEAEKLLEKLLAEVKQQFARPEVWQAIKAVVKRLRIEEIPVEEVERIYHEHVK